MRADEGILARWHKDTNGSITPGGTVDAITVAANQTLSAYYDGLEIAFQAAGTNTGAVTLNVDSVGAKSVVHPDGSAMAAGEIASGSKVVCIYNGTKFQIVSYFLDATIAASETAAAASAAAAAADAVSTAADVVLTNADVVLTNADVVSTGNDVTSTNADVVSTSADVVTTTAIANSYSVSWNFSTTTAMADPGSGNMRFNNATPASVTAIAVDDLDSNAVDQSSYVISWDDSTNTNKGTLTVKQGTSSAIFTITGLTDNVGWTQLAVTYVSGGGSFSDATLTFGGFARSGDVGGGGDLLAANNLSDVDTAATALSNIGGIGAATTDTLTNKTFDANGTGNSLSNVDVADLANGTDGELITWDAAGAPAKVGVGTAAQVLTSNGVGAAPTFQDAASGGKLLSQSYAETSTSGSTSTTIPADNTIPQNTEGAQVLTVTHNRQSATSTLLIEVNVAGLSSAGWTMCAAVFQDATANALASGLFYQDSANIEDGAVVRARIASGSTGNTTFNVRVGPNGGTLYWNRAVAGDIYGGTLTSSITVTEVEA